MTTKHKEIMDQFDYRDYLRKVNMNPSSMSYYQWKHRKDKPTLKRSKENVKVSPIKKIKQAEESKDKSLREALNEQELRRLGYRRSK
jgi:hypothetical protein